MKNTNLTMKMVVESPLQLVALAGLGLLFAGSVTAQTFTTLHSFTATYGSHGGYTNSDGAIPYGSLILSGNTLYGAARLGGSMGFGTVFAVNTNGTGFTALHSFDPAIASDGSEPYVGPILSGNTLYGTTIGGGASSDGTVFALKTDGTGFMVLHSFSFSGSGGYNPLELVLSGSVLYGVASSGNVFALNTDSSGFTTLYGFSFNNDGGCPMGLTLSGNTLYGLARLGGSSGNGTVFKVNTDGTGFSVLHSFTTLYNNTNSDGASPHYGLIVSGNTLYGTAYSGGSSGNGTVFALNTDGSAFTTLYSFSARNNWTNSDGANPISGLILSGHTLYGTAQNGGPSNNGTVFKLYTDGTGFSVLHSFTALLPGTNTDGTSPNGGLILSGNTLFGTASGGGNHGNGTVFSILLPPELPHLTITSAGANIILSWPTNATGFTLQSTPSLESPVWTTNSLAPVVVNGQNTVTNPVCGPQQFYRLSPLQLLPR